MTDRLRCIRDIFVIKAGWIPLVHLFGNSQAVVVLLLFYVDNKHVLTKRVFCPYDDPQFQVLPLDSACGHFAPSILRRGFAVKGP